MQNIKAFCTSKTCKLFQETCSYLGIEPCYLNKVQFANGELSIRFSESVRNLPVVLFVQQTQQINTDLMELLLAINAAKGAGASTIIVVWPCSPYARQNQSNTNLLPTSSFIGNLMAYAGVLNWITVDLHEPVLPNKALRIHNLSAHNLLLERFKELYPTKENWICVAADEGAIKRTQSFANALAMPFGFCRKIRENNQVKILELVGDVAQKSVLLIDDMIDSGKTLQAASTYLHQNGARNIVCAVTHGITRQEVFSNLATSPIAGLIETNTLPILENGFDKDLNIVSVAPLLAQKLKELLY